MPVVRGGGGGVGILNAKEERNGFTKNPKLLSHIAIATRGAGAATITERQVIGQVATQREKG